MGRKIEATDKLLSDTKLPGVQAGSLGTAQPFSHTLGDSLMRLFPHSLPSYLRSGRTEQYFWWLGAEWDHYQAHASSSILLISLSPGGAGAGTQFCRQAMRQEWRF